MNLSKHVITFETIDELREKVTELAQALGVAETLDMKASHGDVVAVKAKELEQTHSFDSQTQIEKVETKAKPESKSEKPEGKPKRHRRTRAEIEAAKMAETPHVNGHDTEPDAEEVQSEDVTTPKGAEKTPAQVMATHIVAPTKEAAVEALQKVNANKGISTAREILIKFSAQRISDIKETDYPAFIKECQGVLHD